MDFVCWVLLDETETTYVTPKYYKTPAFYNLNVPVWVGWVGLLVAVASIVPILEAKSGDSDGNTYCEDGDVDCDM